MSVICPGLYRDKDKFICKYINAPVNPALRPCLSDYTLCEIYVRELKKSRKEKEETVTETKEVREEVVVTPVIEGISAEGLLNELVEIERELMKLDGYWTTYENAAKSVIKKWSQLRERTLRRLSSIDQIIQSLLEEEKELDFLKEMKLITDDFYNRERNKIKSQLDNLEGERAKLAAYLERIERMAETHYNRIRIMTAKAELSKLRLSLAKLEQLYRKGEIDKDTYERMKSEIEEEIKRLEKFV